MRKVFFIPCLLVVIQWLLQPLQNIFAAWKTPNVQRKKRPLIILGIILTILCFLSYDGNNSLSPSKLTDTNWENGRLRANPMILLFEKNSNNTKLADNHAFRVGDKDYPYQLNTAGDYYHVTIKQPLSTLQLHSQALLVENYQTWDLTANDARRVLFFTMLLTLLLLPLNTQITNVPKTFRHKQDLFRVLGILLVVIGHSAYDSIGAVHYSSFFQSLDSSGVASFMHRLVGNIYQFHMPLFFFLSGMIYYLTQDKFSTLEQLTSKKFHRLIMPGLFYAVIFVVPVKYLCGFFGEADFFQVIFSVFRIHNTGHLWFLFSLFWVFILFHIIAQMICSRNDWLMFGIIAFLSFYKDFWQITLPGFSQVLDGYNGLLFFAVGYWYSKALRHNTMLADIGIIGGLIVLFVIAESLQLNSLANISVTTCKILLTYQLCTICLLPTLLKSKLYLMLLQYNFMIYILHDPLNYVVLALFYRMGETGLPIDLYYSLFYFCRTIVIIALTIIIAKLLNKLRKSFRFIP